MPDRALLLFARRSDLSSVEVHGSTCPDAEESEVTSNVVGRHIVAAVDGSPSALDAVRWAADEAARRGMSLRLTHAVNIAAIAYGGAYAWPSG